MSIYYRYARARTQAVGTSVRRWGKMGERKKGKERKKEGKKEGKKERRLRAVVRMMTMTMLVDR